MTDDGRLLLAAVLEHPADDAPRAMYADWLQSQDRPRDRWLGEFVACQLAGRPWDGLINLDALVGEVASDLRGYGVRLHHCPNVFSHAATYWATSAADDSKPWFDVNRGFVCGADLGCGDFVRCAGALFARHPIDRVELTDRRSGRFQFSQINSGFGHVSDHDWTAEISADVLPYSLWSAFNDTRIADGISGTVFSDANIRRWLSGGCCIFGRAEARARAARNAP